MRIVRLSLFLTAFFFSLMLLPAPAASSSDSSPLTRSNAGATAAVDLRPVFKEYSLTPRRQGKRPTCSVFTVVGALEFAVAKRQGHTPRLSVEFLNWAANRACGDHQDGGFFSDLWKGFAAYGICTEADMPYASKLDLKNPPSAGAMADAKTRLGLGLRLHWIKEWNVNTGLTDEHFAGIKHTLESGWPVCAGLRWPKHEQWVDHVLQMCGADAVRDGHSVLVVGYRDDAAQPGGGVLIFRNTAGNGQDGMMPYAYAREYMNDAVWIDYESRLPLPAHAANTGFTNQNAATSRTRAQPGAHTPPPSTVRRMASRLAVGDTAG